MLSWKRAEMSIFGAIMAFIMVLIIFPSYQYMIFSETIATETTVLKDTLLDVAVADTQIKFDSYKDMYENDNKNVTDNNTYIEAILTHLGYEDNDNNGYWEKGEFEISEPKLTYHANSHYYNLSFKLSAPFKILGRTVTRLTFYKNVSAAIDTKFV